MFRGVGAVLITRGRVTLGVLGLALLLAGFAVAIVGPTANCSVESASAHYYLDPPGDMEYLVNNSHSVIVGEVVGIGDPMNMTSTTPDIRWRIREVAVRLDQVLLDDPCLERPARIAVVEDFSRSDIEGTPPNLPQVRFEPGGEYLLFVSRLDIIDGNYRWYLTSGGAGAFKHEGDTWVAQYGEETASLVDVQQLLAEPHE